ncbi:Putative pre-16S rRNA nuclease Yqg [hydrothermal vent metagenome]|uniref:Pre-16S rRNA nuclease Yqg n=1 Tax=hydrothermal vent metagenome TaxID=652676 RepID=A0A3B1AFN6_9ZZZZ
MSDRTLLGFDYGRKRIGIAVGQEITQTAQGLTTLTSTDGPDWDNIDRLLNEWRPQMLVVGMPHNMDDRAHPLHDEVKAFGDQLAERYNLPVEWIDERLSSVEAEALLAAGSKSRQKKQDKAEIDKLAAQIILQSWLNR